MKETPTYEELVDDYSYTELVKPKSDLEAALETVKKKTAERLREEYRQAAEESGLTLAEVLAKPKKTKSAATVQYRDPEDAANTWSGRGRKPKWVEDCLERGLTLDDLSVTK